MKKSNLFMSLIVLMLGIGMSLIKAQDRTLYFDVNGAGVSKPITWGLDLAWLSEGNILRGIGFMGADRVDVVRSSFIPTDPVVNGQLTGNSLTNTNLRLNIISNRLGANTRVVLNCDHPSVHSWYVGNAANWAQLIDVTTVLHQNIGRTVITVSPFNEPDYTATGQGTMADFYNICGVLEGNSRFNNIRISGGNTLNTDQALTWYNYLKARLDEGNTHQLAGSFANYATFFQTVRANGDYASNDELHNVMEAMVGVEYGMQTGIWWGTAEYARGEFVKASDGVRLSYAEHRTNWTAASVYRAPDGKVQAFIGGSERQAATTTYKFVSQNMPVFFDGQGPLYEYTITYPGGAVGSYQNGQTNAEKVINITWGEDIQPVINGAYVIVNRNSGKVMEVAGQSTADGANIQQWTNTGNTNQRWNVTPVNSRIGGDFSYFSITSVQSGKSLDINNWSLENGGNIQLWATALGGNQQWYLEYAGDGWFYIRSRHSAKALDVYNSSTADGGNICQWDKSGNNQQWRFLPVGTAIEFTAPNAPTNLTGTGNASNITLSWTASTSSDVSGYTIFRAKSGGAYNTLARNITTTSYTDNDVTSGVQYYYKIKAVDRSLNRSAYSNERGPLTITGSTSVYYGLQNRATGLYVDGIGRTANGSACGQWTGSGSNNQKWILEVSGSYYKIKNVTTGLYIDGMGLTTNGSACGQYAGGSSYNQQWTRESTGSYYKFRNRATGLYLDGMGRTANGSDLGQWASSSSYNQQFSLVTLSSAAGENDYILSNTLNLYPNPANNELNIQIDNISTNGADLHIYSSTGQLLFNERIFETSHIIDISAFNHGIYAVQINNGDKILKSKFIKK